MSTINTYRITSQVDDAEHVDRVDGTHYRKTENGDVIVFNRRHDEENVAEISAEHFVSIIKDNDND